MPVIITKLHTQKLQAICLTSDIKYDPQLIRISEMNTLVKSINSVLGLSKVTWGKPVQSAVNVHASCKVFGI